MQGRYYRRTKPPRKWRRLAFLLACLLLVLALVYTAGMVRNLQSFHNREDWARELRHQGSGEQTVYLVYGVDYWGACPYVDRAVLLYRDRDNLKAVYVPGNVRIGEEALGQLYQRGESGGFVHHLQEYLGIPVNHYLQISYQGLAELEELWGEVPVAHLPGALPELVPAGEQGLTGFELYHYFLAAGREETALQQLERQRQILLALWNKIIQRPAWGRPRLFKALAPYLETDLSWKELQALHEDFKDCSFSTVEIIHLPGKEEVHHNRLYWAADRKDLERLGRALRGEGEESLELRIEVLNGTGVAGQAADLTEALTREGLQVIKTGNAAHFSYETTEVISLGATIEPARVVLDYLVGAVISHQPDPEAEADVRIIIGRDYLRRDTTN